MQNSYLGGYLRNLRGERSLREFAKKIGISHTYLDGIEKGIDRNSGKPNKVSVETVITIAVNLGVNRNKIFELAAKDCQPNIVIKS